MKFNRRRLILGLYVLALIVKESGGGG